MATTTTSTTIDSPCTLQNGMILKNRLVKAAMTESLSDDYGRATKELHSLYGRWSRGGASLLLTGNIQVDRRYIERPGNVCIDGRQDEESRKLLRDWAKIVHDEGSKLMGQISHGGRQSNGMINLEPIGPGSIALKNIPSSFIGHPRMMTLEEIEDVKHRFVNAAKVLKECGFDGIQIHSAHGYLLSSFLNPLANNRTDEYGGLLENRARLLLEILNLLRSEGIAPCKEFAISVKINTLDLQEGGFSTKDAAQVVAWLEGTGIVDILELSGGNYDSGIYLREDGVLNPSKVDTNDRQYRKAMEQSYFLQYANEIREQLPASDDDNNNNNKTINNKMRMKIMVTGGWRHKKGMNAALEEGKCSLIGLGRPLCGDPYGCSKLLTGTEEEELSQYEQLLQVGIGPVSWLLKKNARRFPLCAGIIMIAKQSWYYCCIYNWATAPMDETNVLLPIGCFRSTLSNMKHEETKAKNLKGSVDCHGKIHNPKKETTTTNFVSTPMMFVLVVPAMAVSIWIWNR